MSYNGLSMGIGQTVIINDPNATITFTPNQVTRCSISFQPVEGESRPMTGPPIPYVNYGSGRITLMLNRVGPDVGIYFTSLASAQFQVVSQLGGTITVINRDAKGVNEMIYTNCVCVDYSPGEASGVGVIEESLTYRFSMAYPLP